MHRFTFAFAEYNGYGFPDFALGQYASSDARRYEIFSIEPHGIERLAVAGGTVFAAPNLGYSPLFRKVSPKAFTTTFYDNAKATWYRATSSQRAGSPSPSREGSLVVSAARR